MRFVSLEDHGVPPHEVIVQLHAGKTGGPGALGGQPLRKNPLPQEGLYRLVEVCGLNPDSRKPAQRSPGGQSGAEVKSTFPSKH